MIPILLRDLRWRLLLVAGIGWLLYLLEPGFHVHEGPLDPDEAIGLSAVGVSATLSYFAGLAMIVLLAGFVSTDRREGYTRLFLNRPLRPLALYGLRWGLAYALAVGGALVLLVAGQIVAWGELRGGWVGLLLPALNAAVYGGIMAFLSVTLRRGDAWVAFLLFLPTFVPQILAVGLELLPAPARAAVSFLLPPQGAMQVLWEGLLAGRLAWGAAAFALGYATAWLALAGLVLQHREWP